MDKVVFEVIDKERMLVNKCIYYEPDDNGEYYSVHYIDFSLEELSKLFKSFLKKYYKDDFITDEELSSGITRITFYDVDYDEMTDIMDRLKEYHDKMSLNRMIQDSIKRTQNKPQVQALEVRQEVKQRPAKIKINKKFKSKCVA